MPDNLSDRALFKSTDTYSSNVVGEFQVAHDQFLVICLENQNLENSLEKHLVQHCPELLPAEAGSYQEIARFEVQGQPCAIVKLISHSHSNSSSIDDLHPATLLTERELQIATLVAQGRPNKQIANQLRISEWTVSTHLRRIFIKLGVESRAAMVYRCASLIQPIHYAAGSTLPL